MLYFCVRVKVWSLPQAMLQWFHIYFVYPSMESTTTINKDNDFVSPVYNVMHIEVLYTYHFIHSSIHCQLTMQGLQVKNDLPLLKLFL